MTSRIVWTLVIAVCVLASCTRKEELKAPIPRPEDALLNRGGLPRGAAPASPSGAPADIPASSVKEAMKPKGLPHVAEVQDRSTFALNKNLLGATITDAAYRFKFDPPRTWARFSASEVEASMSGVRPPAQSGFTAVLLYGFRDASSGAVMLVAAIKPPPNIRDSSFAEQMDAYGPIVEAQFRPTPVRVSGFIKGALRIVQFQAQSKPQVVYRLVFNNKRKELIVVEFTVPRTSFDNDIQELESVIASLDVVK